MVKEDYIHTLFRTPEWDIVNIIHLWKIQVVLKQIYSLQNAQEKFFFSIKVDFKVDFKSRLNLMDCLKNQGCF